MAQLSLHGDGDSDDHSMEQTVSCLNHAPAFP